LLTLDANAVATALPYDQLIDTLKKAFSTPSEVPQRAQYEVAVPDGAPGTLLLMPAWQPGSGMGVKIATVFTDNAKRGKPAVFASYLLMSAETGVPVAMLDGSELTLRRTAAASALASSYLSREDTKTLLMVGTGNLAPHLIAAHATVRPISEVRIWGRRPDAAKRLANSLSSAEFSVTVVENLEDAARSADIISCATLAMEPLIMGEWLSEGQHLDLVGAFKPDMCEVDEAAVLLSDVYVDTRVGALSEAGEIVQAIENGAMSEADIKGELAELTSGSIAGRSESTAITLFKSVGTALEDLAAAELVMKNL
jgi:ornithine cyclodeaminase